MHLHWAVIIVLEHYGHTSTYISTYSTRDWMVFFELLSSTMPVFCCYLVSSRVVVVESLPLVCCVRKRLSTRPMIRELASELGQRHEQRPQAFFCYIGGGPPTFFVFAAPKIGSSCQIVSSTKNSPPVSIAGPEVQGFALADHFGSPSLNKYNNNNMVPEY